MAKKRRRGYYGSRRSRVQRRQKVLIGIIVLVVIGATVQTLSPIKLGDDAAESVSGEQVLLVSNQIDTDETLFKGQPLSPLVRPEKEVISIPITKQYGRDRVVVREDISEVKVKRKSEPEANKKPLAQPSVPVVPTLKDDIVGKKEAKENGGSKDKPSLAMASYQRGKHAFEATHYFAASQSLTKAFEAGLGRREQAAARNMLNQASDQWLFSSTTTDENTMCAKYKVASGDNFESIGKKWGVPYQLIMKINGIKNARHLRAGQTIKLIGGPFDAKVFLDRFEMIVYLKGVIVRTYRVTVGAKGRETPTGLWHVGTKQENPEWYDNEAVANGTKRYYMPNDPENPLGDFWIALKGVAGDAVGRKSIGIHGTTRDGEIGGADSRGCVRLHNNDMTELFYLLKDGRSKVTIIK